MSQVNIFQSFAVEKKSEFDVEKLSDRFRRGSFGWTIPEAYLGVLLAASMADGDWDAAETEAIKEIVRRSRAMASLSPGDLEKANQVVSQRLTQNRNALQEACQTLPVDMCLPVFANCVDIILADGQLLNAESEFLNRLVDYLELDHDSARRVLEVMLLKGQY